MVFLRQVIWLVVLAGLLTMVVLEFRAYDKGHKELEDLRRQIHSDSLRR